MTGTDPTGEEPAATPPALFARLIATAVALRERFTGAGRRSPAAERAMLGAATLLFVGATVLAARSLPNVHSEPDYFLLVLVGVLGVPAATLVNAAEYVTAGKALGHRVGLLHAARVSTVATAANLLPIPGAVMVRARALRVLGTNYRKSLAILGGIGVIWLATTGVLAAGALVIAGYNVAIGLAFGVGGVVTGAGGYALVRISVGGEDTMKWFLRFVVIEIASVGVFAVRFTLVLEGLGFHASWSQTLTLTIATAAASAVGILPAGLGVRELLAAALAPLVNLKPAVALFAVSVDRIIGLVVLAIMSGMLVVISHGREITGEEEDNDDANDVAI